MSHFADQLAAALKTAKVSRSELARRIGCPRCSVSDWCVGRHRPRQPQVDRINEVLGSNLTLSEEITAARVAKSLGISVEQLQRALKLGTTDIGFATPSRNGKRYHYTFYPVKVAEKCGI